jgi:hypothetical protein
MNMDGAIGLLVGALVFLSLFARTLKAKVFTNWESISIGSGLGAIGIALIYILGRSCGCFS